MEFLKKELNQVITLGLVYVLFAYALHEGSYKYMENKSTEMLVPIDSADKIQDKIIQSSVNDTFYKATTIKNQYYVSKQLKKYYMNMAVNYNNNYYRFSICFVVFTTLLTIILFLVAAKGWQNTNNFLKALFLLTTLLASFYFFLPNVFNNKENLQNNLGKVIVFQKLQSNIISFSNTLNQTDQRKVDSMITNINDTIKNNYNFIINIDPQKVNFTPSDALKVKQ
jgi:hypothetical protein